MKKMICLSLAWKLMLIFSADLFGQEREQWVGHYAHEVVQSAQKDLPAPHVSAFSIGIPVDVNKNCIYDPKGDTYSGDPSRIVDLTQVCGGNNGSVAELQMTFTMQTDVYGYICLDTDRNPDTGKRFRIYRTGLKGIGCDFELDLFEVMEYGVVYISDISGDQIGSFPARMDGGVLKLEIPLSIIKDNGNMNVAVIVGDSWGPTDWLDVPAPAQSSSSGYNTWLPIFVAETAVYPNGGKFNEGMTFQVNTFSNAAPEVPVSRVRVFLNGNELFGNNAFPFRGSLPMSIGFGISFPAGRNKFLVLMETSAGTFADEVEFEIVPGPLAAPTRSKPPIPASVPSSPFPTPPSLPPFPPGKG